ncbi:MAG: VCBS repeat-containing protein [Chitinophagaceae bacterium]|nr:VCBS repeat-containing protein [Chitinophagaceae bacterium]
MQVPFKFRKAFLAILLSSTALFFSCNNKKKKEIFTQVPASETHIDFVNNLDADKSGLSILYYLYYYNGGGVAVGDINNDGLPDIYFTSNIKAGNKLYLNKGGFQFEDITAKAGVAGISDWCSGATMADVNGDGLLDIYVSTVSQKYGLKGHNELYINNGNGTFSEKSEQYGLNSSCFTTQAVFFDYDHDGDLDCYILNQSHRPHSNIVDTSARRKYDTLSGDRLYRNDIKTTGKFTDVSAQAGISQSNLGYGLGIAVADMNNDGWDDIYIGNDFHENDYYYINQKNGKFKEEGANHFKHYSRFSMGNDIADYNNDGQLDLVTVDMLPSDEKILKTYGSDENADIYKIKLEMNGFQKQYSRNMLQRNNGNGNSFSETGLMSGISATDWSWSPLFADFDNDGNKDLFITSGIVKRPVDLDYVNYISDMQRKKGLDQTNKFDKEAIANMPDGSSHPYLFMGDGKLKFQDMSADWGIAKMKGYYTGAAYADLDNDGNLDMIINAINSPAVILKNNAPKKNYLSILFKGDGMNSFGISTKAYVFEKGRMQYQELMLTRGFQSSSDTRLHFGLDSTKNIDSILIVWPDQKYQTLKNITANKQIIISQKDAGGVFNYTSYFKPAEEMYTDISSKINVNWKHQENDFVDYNAQYLIPHAQSTRGPKIAVADVNGDGLDDFYVCGASGELGALMIQTKDGKFVQSTLKISNRIKMTEEVDAVFFDANNDGFPDLYVVSGGNEYADNNPALLDQLYMNDGKGNFTQSQNAIPKIYKNKSCVTAADFDKDGDIDLFVGGLAEAKKYGIPQDSYLLINDGKGNFTKADKSIIQLDTLGIVTTASFTDINKDGWPDLVVTGEWMPMKIFMNHQGKYTETDISKSTGLWQTVYATDVNGDGFPDLLAGNWGHNSKLYAGKNGPLKLYVKDFDKNGTLEQIMCYTVDGKEYTFLAKDELERALPVLKKAYLKYDEVAGKTVQYMFYDLFNEYRELQAETLGSACFLNDGKGNFTKMDLPDALQYAPVFSFAHATAQDKGSFLAAGNFYGVIPYEGRYDALLPTSFSFNSKLNQFQTGEKATNADGEIRDAKWIRWAGGKQVLVVARNNAGLLFFQKENKSF